eukprot:349589-Chlamydomonas_euryale.AAC.1
MVCMLQAAEPRNVALHPSHASTSSSPRSAPTGCRHVGQALGDECHSRRPRNTTPAANTSSAAARRPAGAADAARLGHREAGHALRQPSEPVVVVPQPARHLLQVDERAKVGAPKPKARPELGLVGRVPREADKSVGGVGQEGARFFGQRVAHRAGAQQHAVRAARELHDRDARWRAARQTPPHLRLPLEVDRDVAVGHGVA